VANLQLARKSWQLPKCFLILKGFFGGPTAFHTDLYCLTFPTYDKVFAAIGFFLLELLETEYFTYLPRSPERSKMTCAWSGDYVSSKRWLEALVEFLS